MTFNLSSPPVFGGGSRDAQCPVFCPAEEQAHAGDRAARGGGPTWSVGGSAGGGPGLRRLVSLMKMVYLNLITESCEDADSRHKFKCLLDLT